MLYMPTNKVMCVSMWYVYPVVRGKSALQIRPGLLPLPIFLLKILLPCPISSYQYDDIECGVGRRCEHLLPAYHCIYMCLCLCVYTCKYTHRYHVSIHSCVDVCTHHTNTYTSTHTTNRAMEEWGRLNPVQSHFYRWLVTGTWTNHLTFCVCFLFFIKNIIIGNHWPKLPALARHDNNH